MRQVFKRAIIVCVVCGFLLCALRVTAVTSYATEGQVFPDFQQGHILGKAGEELTVELSGELSAIPKWSVSDSKIAEIVSADNKKVVLKLLKTGEFYVQYEFNGVKKSARVHVEQSLEQQLAISNFGIATGSSGLNVGEVFTIELVAEMPVVPNWSVSDPNLAKVIYADTKIAKVKMLAPGIVHIYAELYGVTQSTYVLINGAEKGDYVSGGWWDQFLFKDFKNFDTYKLYFNDGLGNDDYDNFTNKNEMVSQCKQEKKDSITLGETKKFALPGKSIYMYSFTPSETAVYALWSNQLVGCASYTHQRCFTNMSDPNDPGGSNLAAFTVMEKGRTYWLCTMNWDVNTYDTQITIEKFTPFQSFEIKAPKEDLVYFVGQEFQLQTICTPAYYGGLANHSWKIQDAAIVGFQQRPLENGNFWERTFEAKKAGKTTITTTVNGKKKSIDVYVFETYQEAADYLAKKKEALREDKSLSVTLAPGERREVLLIPDAKNSYWRNEFENAQYVIYYDDVKNDNLTIEVPGVEPLKLVKHKKTTGWVYPLQDLTTYTVVLENKGSQSVTLNWSVAQTNLPEKTIIKEAALHLTVGEKYWIIPDVSSIAEAAVTPVQKWASTDKAVIQVSVDGLVTAKSAGTAQVQVRCADGSEKNIDVIVTAQKTEEKPDTKPDGEEKPSIAPKPAETLAEAEKIQINAILAQAQAGDTVEIPVKKEEDADIKITHVEVNAETLKDIAEKEVVLVIPTDHGKVEIKPTVLETIVGEDSDSTIKFEISTYDPVYLEETKKETLKDEKPVMVISASILKETQHVHEFGGKTITVTVPFVPEEGKNYVVLYVADDGTVERMKTSCGGGVMQFETTHFSEFIIVEEMEKGTANAQGAIVWIAAGAGAVMLAAAGVLIVKRKKKQAT